jgi:hypothetical protein
VRAGLVNLGHESGICSLRPLVKPQDGSGLMAVEVRAVSSNFTPRNLLAAQIWLIRSGPAGFRRCWQEVVRYFQMHLPWRLNPPYEAILPSRAI